MLEKHLTYWDILFAGIGYILGAGIYALIGIVCKYSQNMIWLSIIFTGIITLITSYSYIKLSSINDSNSSEYDILSNAYGNKFSLLVMILNLFGVIFSCATISIGFGNYLESLIRIPSLIGGVIILLSTTLLNLYPIKLSVKINNITTLIESFGLIIIIIFGMSKWKMSKLANFNNLPPIGNLLYGSYLFSFAFFGFETLVRLSEETIDAKTNIPLAIRDSIIICCILYALVSMSSVSLLDWNKLSKSKAPLAEVINATGIPYLFGIISIIALASTYNTVLMSLLTNSRLLHGLIKQKAINIPVIEKFIDLKKLDKNNIPTNSVWLNGILSIIIMFLFRNLETLTSISNIGVIILILFINLAHFSKGSKIMKKKLKS